MYPPSLKNKKSRKNANIIKVSVKFSFSIQATILSYANNIIQKEIIFIFHYIYTWL